MDRAIFAIWCLFVYGPAPTSCDASILQGALRTQFFISPAFRAVVRTSILMASQHSPIEQIEASLGSLQISNIPMAEVNGQWMSTIFFVLADFLEEASVRHESRLTKTLEFFTSRSPVQRIPPSCQGRIARWFLALADGIPSELHEAIFWAFHSWLTHMEYSVNFDDVDARGVLCEAFRAFSDYDDDSSIRNVADSYLGVLSKSKLAETSNSGECTRTSTPVD
ncbi:hypothetical protein FB45DRAFT_898981 [Roridomyces roridus]|uniref:Uncharacterized protein n=1 Tax=Roridomyces roridus TaxID=1738132 RepID=A0AAD7CCG0_9AGAR|nr:hypothetical protein FB45DRAFT_898981 [Roridomyces roridus]